MKIIGKLNYKIYLNVFVFYWALLALTNSGLDNSEGGFHYQVAEHIIKHGQLGFDTPQPGIFSIAPNGRTYASHEIGNTLFFIPTAFINILLENTLSIFLTQDYISELVHRSTFSNIYIVFDVFINWKYVKVQNLQRMRIH